MNLLAKKRLVSLLLVAWLSGLRAASAQFYWSGDAVSQGGSGTWSAAGVNWGAAAAGPYTLANSGNNNNSVFGGVAGTVTVSGSVNNRSLQFDVPGYVITGGTIFRSTTPNGIIVTGGLGNDATIDTDFSLPSGGRILKQGANTTTLNGTNNRGTNVEAGSIIAGINARIGITIINSGAALVLDSGQAGNLRLADGSAALLTMNAGGTLASSNAGGITISQATIAGTGTFNFGNATYTGGITFTPNLASTAARTWNVAANTTVTFTGNLTGVAGSYTKDGSGTVILSGVDNTYDGGTTISAGRLLVNNASNSGTGTAAIVVNGGTLGGTGSFTGAVTLNSGGTLAPGTGIESLAMGAVTFNANSTYAYEFDTTNLNGDFAKVTGNLSLDPAAQLTLTDLNAGTVALGNKLTLINYNGTWNNTSFSGYADDSTFMFGANNWLINYNDTAGGTNFTGDEFAPGTSSFVTLTAVAIPEPGTTAWVLLLGTSCVWTLAKRRRLNNG